MQFDPTFYNSVLQTAHAFLKGNIGNVGQQFADSFMNSYNPNPNNQQTMQNAQNFFQAVANEAMRQNNGAMVVHNNDQLYQIVGMFINQVWQQYRQQMGNQNQNQFQMGNNNNNNSMGFSFNGQNNGGGMRFGNRNPGPSTHLGGDDVDTRPVQQTQAAAASAPMSFTAPSPTTEYVANPLDDVPETGVEFVSMDGKFSWGGDEPVDNRIMLGVRQDVKTRDERFTVQVAIAYHQQILNDPSQVMRDFFEVVPDTVLGSVFSYVINYNHLDILDVPMQDFIELREDCFKAVQADPTTMIHRTLMNKLKNMRVGPFEAVQRYLVQHVNRALYLSARLIDKPKYSIAISELKDLEELLSSSFNGAIVQHPNGRSSMETIVGNALWNALIKNVSVMFEDKDTIPTNAIQSSPAFPFSLKNVYPNKYSIPTSNDSDKDAFMAKLQEHVLDHKTYLLSRRRVVITNAVGKNVLSKLGEKATAITTPLAQLIAMPPQVMSFNSTKHIAPNSIKAVKPYAAEAYPTEQFQEYESDPKAWFESESERFRGTPPDLPLDQTIFVIQYGVKPTKYLEAMDIMTTIDNEKRANTILAAKRKVDTLHITE